MSCKICGRGSCTESFHSLEEQERYELKQSMSADVDDLRDEILQLKEDHEKEVAELKAEQEVDDRMIESLNQACEAYKNEVKELKQKLEIAVEALDYYNSRVFDDWVNIKSREALKKIRGEA